MLTPQEVSERAFSKASFGGYNMSQVDEFLDILTGDYTALYNENAVLKSKMKVLVEKVEEYRATEDSMRATLLTAQRMADSIVKEAEAKRDDILKKAESAAREKLDGFRKEAEDSDRRLRRGGNARIDASQNNHRAKQRKKAVLPYRQQSLFMEFPHNRIDFFLVLAIFLTVINHIQHQQASNQQAWDNPGQEQIADRRAGGHAIHNKRDAGRDNDPKPSSHSHYCRRKSLVIPQPHQNGDRHAAYGSHRSRRRPRNRAIKQAGDNHGAGDTRRQPAQEKGKDVK